MFQVKGILSLMSYKYYKKVNNHYIYIQYMINRLFHLVVCYNTFTI